MGLASAATEVADFASQPPRQAGTIVKDEGDGGIKAGRVPRRAQVHLRGASMAEVLVLAEHAGGEVKKVTLELLTLARQFGEPVAVWAGAGAEQGQARLAEYGAIKVYVANGAGFDRLRDRPGRRAAGHPGRAEIAGCGTARRDPAEQRGRGPAGGQDRFRRAHRRGRAHRPGSGKSWPSSRCSAVPPPSVRPSSTGMPVITVRPNSAAPEPAPGGRELEAVEVTLSEAAKGARITGRVAAEQPSGPG